MKNKQKKAWRRNTFLLKPPGKRYIFTKELELTELVFDEQTKGQVSLFEPVHDLTPTSQLLRDVGKEPVGCRSEMDIDVWATLILLCTFRHPMSLNTPEFVYIWISWQDITYKN